MMDLMDGIALAVMFIAVCSVLLFWLFVISRSNNGGS